MTTNDTNWWQRFYARWFGGGKRLDKGGAVEPFNSVYMPSGTAVTAETSLKLSAVWACVRLRSQTISSLPLHLRSADNGTANNHPLHRILHDAPNADMTASEFWEAMVVSIDLWGNAYALINRNRTGQVVSLDVLDPSITTVKREKSGEISYLVGDTLYPSDDVLHIKGFTLDGLVGLSPIRYQASVMGAQIDANNAANHTFSNNLKAGGFLQTGQQVLTAEQRERLRNNMTFFAKPENAGKYMVLEAGMTVAANSVKINPADAQLLESRYFGIEEICRAFGVPPQLIYHTDKSSSWASSLEGMNLGFLMYSLRPTLVRIEQAIVKKLLTPAERAKYKPKFAVEGLLRADSHGRSQFYMSALQNGWMTRNEVRALEDLPPVAGGDSLTVQLNLTPLEQLGQDTEQSNEDKINPI